jgi:putative multiple sugar transport system substrate-binding protein
MTAHQGSKNVDYYATFDNYQVALQASYRAGAEAQGRQGALQHELLCGRSTTTTPLHNGAMSVPALHRQRQAGGAASRWAWTRSDRADRAVVQARMDNLLSAYYEGP